MVEFNGVSLEGSVFWTRDSRDLVRPWTSPDLAVGPRPSQRRAQSLNTSRR